MPFPVNHVLISTGREYKSFLQFRYRIPVVNRSIQHQLSDMLGDWQRRLNEQWTPPTKDAPAADENSGKWKTTIPRRASERP